MTTNCLYIGRFQPLHLGHQSVINQMFQSGFNPVIGIGSCNVGRTPNNPLYVPEREELIYAVFNLNYSSQIQWLYDFDKDEDWFNQVKKVIDECNITHITGVKKPEDFRLYKVYNKLYINNHYIDIICQEFGLTFVESDYHKTLGINICGRDIRNDLEANKAFVDYRVYNKLIEVYDKK